MAGGKQIDLAEFGHRPRDGEVKLGTTIMAVEFDGGVVVGADSRTSTGSYVYNRATDKLCQLHDKIFCCVSGSAADSQFVTENVKVQLELAEVSEERTPTVARAAKFAQQYCYEYKDYLL
ncbi:MAG: hypothetical protein MHM6MM_008525, partial [Cercozoa sp. M6MM]